MKEDTYAAPWRQLQQTGLPTPLEEEPYLDGGLWHNETFRDSVRARGVGETDQERLVANAVDRSETRSLRQQLACMSEQCQDLEAKMAKLQEQTAEAYRLLAQERQERLEERNNQLTVVVAKHGLERRLRNREQDLQTEWKRNAELAERCQKLEAELEEARTGHREGKQQTLELPVRSRASPRTQHDSSADDDWSDRPSHVPPEFAYSKLVRWKKRTREANDFATGHGKKQKRTSPDRERGLQLAGSESPPQLGEAEQVGPGASAIDHMISGEFVESESGAGGVGMILKPSKGYESG